MALSLSQARLSMTIERSGMTEAKLAEVLEVSQPTVSRLKNGKIRKIERYQAKLDKHLGKAGTASGTDFADLIELAKSSPALREALMAIQRLMQENA